MDIEKLASKAMEEVPIDIARLSIAMNEARTMITNILPRFYDALANRKELMNQGAKIGEEPITPEELGQEGRQEATQKRKSILSSHIANEVQSEIFRLVTADAILLRYRNPGPVTLSVLHLERLSSREDVKKVFPQLLDPRYYDTIIGRVIYDVAREAAYLAIESEGLDPDHEDVLHDNVTDMVYKRITGKDVDELDLF